MNIACGNTTLRLQVKKISFAVTNKFTHFLEANHTESF